MAAIRESRSSSMAVLDLLLLRSSQKRDVRVVLLP
jgi:hypothetical protein